MRTLPHPPLRVAQLLYSGLGGHGSVAFSLLEADKESQWRPMMGFLGIEPLSLPYEVICKRQGIPYDYIAAIPGQPWRAWPGVFRWLARRRPEAIILHSVTALLPCWWYARRHRVPLIVVEHQHNALKKRSEWAVSRFAMLLGDAVVLLTPAYRQELKQTLGCFYRDSQVRIIPNGVNTTRFAPRGEPVSKQSTVVRLGMAARFTPSKRQDALIDALALLRRQTPAIDWRLSLAGHGETWDAMRHKAGAAGVAHCIDFPGHLNEEELIDWFHGLDIYLHASEGETLSTALLQAMAMGLPIVASDVPGIANLLKGDAEYGLLVPDSKSDGFAKEIQSLTRDAGSAMRLGRTARARVVEAYSQDAMFAAYRELVSHLCQKK